MGSSRCVKCDSTSFELQEADIAGTSFRLLFVQCASCGGVVGVHDRNNIGEMLMRQNDALKQIAQGVDADVEL